MRKKGKALTNNEVNKNNFKYQNELGMHIYIYNFFTE